MNKSHKNKIKTNKELSYARNKLNIHINSKQKQNVKTKKQKSKKQKTKTKTKTRNINPKHKHKHKHKHKPDQTGLLFSLHGSGSVSNMPARLLLQLFFPSFTRKLHRCFSQKSILKLQNSEVLPTGTAVDGRMAALGH